MKALKILSFIFALTLIYDVIYSFLNADEGYKIISISVNVWAYRFYNLTVAVLLLSFSIKPSKLETDGQ